MIGLKEAYFKYINEDVNNPKYIFHGHYYLQDNIIPRKPIMNMTDNQSDTMTAIYGSIKINGAIPYSIKIDSEYDDWAQTSYLYYFIPPEYDYEKAIIDYGQIDTLSQGYIYVLDAINFVKCNEYQWVSLIPCKPIDIINFTYDDVKDYFVFSSVLQR